MRSPSNHAWISVLISPRRSLFLEFWLIRRRCPETIFIGLEASNLSIIHALGPQSSQLIISISTKRTMKKCGGAKCESLIVASNGWKQPVWVFAKPLPTGRHSGLENCWGRFFRNLSRDCEYDAVPLLTEFIPRVTNGPPAACIVALS